MSVTVHRGERAASSRSPLISVEALAGMLDQRSVKIFDVRGKWASPPVASHGDYRASHIPGAVFLNWTRHFLEPDVPINLAPVASRAHAVRSFQALGISEGDLVVLYDDYHHMLAGRIWWAMRYWGFADVKILNGGWQRWQAQGLPISTIEPMPQEGTFKPAVQDHLRVSLDAFIRTKDTASVWDGRGPEGYRGKHEDDRSGHIPGARNIPFKSLLNDDTGLFKEDTALTELFDRESPDWRSANIISSCGAGYAGTVLLAALQQLGVEAPLFDGSFAIWKQDPARPVEQS